MYFKGFSCCVFPGSSGHARNPELGIACMATRTPENATGKSLKTQLNFLETPWDFLFISTKSGTAVHRPVLAFAILSVNIRPTGQLRKILSATSTSPAVDAATSLNWPVGRGFTLRNATARTGPAVDGAASPRDARRRVDSAGTRRRCPTHELVGHHAWISADEGNFPRKFNSISRYFLTFQGIFLLRFPGF